MSLGWGTRDDESCSVGMVGGVGEVGEGGRRRRQKEEENDFVSGEDMKGGGYRLDKWGEANKRQGGLDHV